MNDPLEKEQELLEEQLQRGEITGEEYNREMREMEREYGAQAEERAQEAYDQEMERWY